MKKIVIIICLAASVVFYMAAYAQALQNNISENVIRLHVIANSNSETDQAIKLKVRNEILNNISFESDNVLDLKAEIKSKLSLIDFYANELLKSENVNYTAKSELCISSFPAKKYANIKLPSGEYTAMKISLGDARGENWWCVMFPPLCFTDSATGYISSSSDEILKDNLTYEEYRLISSEETDVQIKFKLIELINKIRSVQYDF